MSPTRLLFHYTKYLSKRNKLKEFIEPKMINLTTLLDNNRNLDVYKGGNIHGLYRYLENIEYPTTLTTSGQRFHQFGT